MSRTVRASVVTGTIISLLSVGPPLIAAGQAPSEPTTRVASAEAVPAPGAGPVVGSDEALDRIRRGLDSQPTLVIKPTALTFHVEVVGKPASFADYLKGSDLGHAAGGGGMDILGLIQQSIRKLRDARRAHEMRQIRTRIDLELAALRGQ